MRIVIGNLPAGISEEDLRVALKPFAPVQSVRLITGSGLPSGLIEMEIPRVAADALARRIQGHVFLGQALNAWVPAMDWYAGSKRENP